MSVETQVWIYSFYAPRRCLRGGSSDHDTILWEETSLTASRCQLVNYLNDSALACTYIMVAHDANCCDCWMIKQLIMMQLTISRGRLTIADLWNMKETSIMIWKDILPLWEILLFSAICLHLYARRVFLWAVKASAKVRLKVALSFKTKKWHKPCRPTPAVIIKLSTELSGIMPTQARSECSDSTSLHR